MKRNLIKSFYILGLVFLFIGTGCTHLVTVTPEEINNNAKEKLSFNVGLYISEKTDSYTISENKKGDTWNFHNLGKATVEAFKKELEKIFTSVRIIKDKNNLFLDINKDLLIIIEPSLLDYNFDIPFTKLQVYPSQIHLKVTIYTPDGYILFSKKVVGIGDIKGRPGFDFTDNPARAAAKAIQDGVNKIIKELYNDKNFIALINGEDISDDLLIADMNAPVENKINDEDESIENSDSSTAVEQKDRNESSNSIIDKNLFTLRGFGGIAFIPAALLASVMTDSLPIGFTFGGGILFGDLVNGWRIGLEVAYLPLLNIQYGSESAKITSIPLVLYFDIGYMQIGGGVSFFSIDETILDENISTTPSLTIYNGFCVDIPISDFINFHFGLANYLIYDSTQDIIPFLVANCLRGGLSIDF